MNAKAERPQANNVTRLCVMMFLQYAIWGAWAVSLGGYMAKTLSFTGIEIAAVFSTTAIAAMVSPWIVGFLADRLFATEKLIGTLHLVGAILLAFAAVETEFYPLYVAMVAYAIVYMPTLALTNSIAFANISNAEKDFPVIRVGGTLGWIAVGLLVGLVLDVPAGTSNTPVLLAAAASLALAIYSFTILPHTPPQGKGKPAAKTGASVLQLLKDRSFLVFVICSFLICIPLSFYYAQANVFLSEIDAPAPTALQTLGQISEVGFMLAMPFFIAKLGVKRMLMCGMLAWGLRYFAFGSYSFSLVFFGLFLHGICYDFFFVASQIYVDNRADDSQRASAQGFIAFITLGVGMFVGSYASGWVVDAYPPVIKIEASVQSSPDEAPITSETILPSWDNSEKKEDRVGLAALLNLEPDSQVKPELVTQALVLTDAAANTKTTYSVTALRKAITDADEDQDGSTTRTEWRVAQRKDWFRIWLWPGVGAVVTCLIFLLLFQQPPSTTAPTDEG